MKKIIIAILLLFIITGCVNINNLEFETLTEEVLASKIEVYNQYRTGYKYYLPRNLILANKTKFNEKIVSSKYTYYLYVDAISFHNKVKNEYETNKNAFYSQAINGENKGYLEINQVGDNYLVELMYNYAKIEVITRKDDLNLVVSNAMVLLSSINYNEKIINNLIGENILHSNEKDFNIFETRTTDSKFIEYIEQYDNYNSEQNEIPDLDLIN